ncbi:MAG TPA: M20/M25/M40 family metallo-hydrolase [Actinomycetota bacterium]|nr:M20/M25/M40 family metallo-hydrolase [Actinomycetota bacterium]
MSGLAAETTELLQQLIRNGCVNDGTRESGQEVRNADVLESYLEGSGFEMQRFEAVPNRPSLVARMEGSDPKAPALLLMGHTDVVPVNPDGWKRDPFGGELVEGEVWGRGAVDMLNLTASMAVALNALARGGFKPRGDLIYLGVPDEEAAGKYGAEWLIDNEPDAVRCDYVLTEMGGFRFAGQGTPKVPVMVAEKGTYWCKIKVHGTPGHGSMPFRTDNALVKAAEIVQRLAAFQPEPVIHETWRRFVEQMGFPDELREPLLDPARVREVAEQLPDLGMARMIHACTHTTFAPTVLGAGVKANVIPDTAELQVDIRTLPGQTAEDVHAMLREALGEYYDSIEIDPTSAMVSTASPVDTPMWDTLKRHTERLSGAETVPFIIVGATDARFFRKVGATCYGYGLFSEKISFGEFASMFHGDNERVDVESLGLTTELWSSVVKDFLG